jgi:hypothetical protein
VLDVFEAVVVVAELVVNVVALGLPVLVDEDTIKGSFEKEYQKAIYGKKVESLLSTQP